MHGFKKLVHLFSGTLIGNTTINRKTLYLVTCESFISGLS